MTTAKILQSRNCQAVQLPKEFEVKSKELEVFRRGDEIILREKKGAMLRAFELLASLPNDLTIADRKNNPPQKRNWAKLKKRGEANVTDISAPKGLAVLGAGKMGGILLEAFLKHGLVTPAQVFATVRQTSSERRSISSAQITLGTDNRAAAKNADVILICVKPLAVGAVLDEIRPELNEQKLVISIAAAVSTEYMEKRVGGNVPVLRAMPNTPSMVGEGITAICKGKHATAKHLELARKLFDSVGKTVVVDEKHMDAVTGLSGSGPAFLYIILESLAEGGVKMGLSRELATLLAAQTMLGAAKVVLETGHHPALLKDTVTTPAGCTIDGILELEEGKLRVTLIKAVVKASQRAKELLFTDKEH